MDPSQLGASSSRASSEARLAEAAAQVASARTGVGPRRWCHSGGTRSAAVVAVPRHEELAATRGLLRGLQRATFAPALLHSDAVSAGRHTFTGHCTAVRWAPRRTAC